jgi:hypothetical protein
VKVVFADLQMTPGISGGFGGDDDGDFIGFAFLMLAQFRGPA